MVPTEEALDRLLSYAAQVAPLLEQRQHLAPELVAYGVRALALVGPNAHSRYREIGELLGADVLDEDYLPSLVDVAELELRAETRHSLLLAWLLDPTRSGPIARLFWSALIDRLKTVVREAPQHDLLPSLDRWQGSAMRSVSVLPERHGVEWENIDVFAHVEHEGQYECGLVIENKVQAATAEQPDQLDRYFDIIRERFGSEAQDRTVFVFLTERGRVPKTAQKSAANWILLGWSDVAVVLADIARGATHLPASYRVWLLQYKDAVVKRILGRANRPDLDRRRSRLARRLDGRVPSDPAWEIRHREVLDLWAELHRRT